LPPRWKKHWGSLTGKGITVQGFSAAKFHKLKKRQAATE
jgi:hypothetical protein